MQSALRMRTWNADVIEGLSHQGAGAFVLGRTLHICALVGNRQVDHCQLRRRLPLPMVYATGNPKLAPEHRGRERAVPCMATTVRSD
jgi:hypothetical protein